MKISLNWIRDFVGLQESPAAVEHTLTMLGLESESREHYQRDLTGVIAASVETCEPLAGSDHLSQCLVNTGADKVQVICGAPNVATGQNICLATVGTLLPDGTKIKKAKLRGVESHGMICSDRELQLSDDHEGIRVLPAEMTPGQSLAELWNYEDDLIDLEITQNRGDCLSIIGVARELSAWYNLPLQKRSYHFTESREPAAEAIQIDVPPGLSCKRYTGRVVRNVTVKPSPRWLQDRLLVVGLRPINNIVDITNYVMWETGHPMHAFDMRQVAGHRITVRYSEPGEKFTTLDEVERELPAETLLICDAEKPVAIGGIMGGLNSGIEDDTTDILLEVAWFEPVNIRMTARRLGLATDSSRRFERGVDYANAEDVINQAVAMIQELAGGDVLAGVVDTFPEPLSQIEITVRPERVNDLSGMEISADAQIALLERLHMQVQPLDQSRYRVTVPTCRFDLEREVDIIEEIVRLHGYDHVPTDTSARIPLVMEEDDALSFRERLRQLMIRQGLQEVSTISMVSRTAQELTGDGEEPLVVDNPISDDLAVMRTRMLPSMLQTAAFNLNRQNSQVALFEINRTFHYDADAYNRAREGETLAVVLTGLRREQDWESPELPFDFYDLRQIVLSLLGHLGQDDPDEQPLEGAGFAASALALLSDTGWVIRYGELDSELTRAFEIKQPVFYLEVSLEALRQRAGQNQFSLRELSRFPDNIRDLTFVVAESVTVGALTAIMKRVAGKWIRTLQPISVYRGKGIDAGQKSLSFRIAFNSLHESLEDQRVDSWINKIIKAVDKEAAGKLR